MSTTSNRVELSVVDSDGNVNIIYPKNNAKDVIVNVTNNQSLPSNINNVQSLVDNIGSMAFEDGDNIVYLGYSDGSEQDYANLQLNTEINDNSNSSSSTWSSSKISSSFTNYIKNSDIEISDISKLPLVPTVFTVDGHNNTFGNVCPTTGYIWVVNYFPVTSNGSTVSKAVQQWTGYQFNGESNTSVKYSRIYVNGNWGSFVEE